MSQFLTIVLVVIVIANIAFARWSHRSLKKLLTREENAKLEDKFVIDHIVHTRSSLNLIYTSIATITILLAFFGLNLKDKVTEELKGEISKTVTEEFKGTAIKEATDTAKIMLANIISNSKQSDGLLDLLQNQLKDLKIAKGETPEDNTPWEKYHEGLRLHISTNLQGMKTTPLYLASLYGISENASAVGVNAIYDASDQGFTVYIFQASPKATIDPAKAKGFKWHVKWAALYN